jgi:integrase/recombinase XerD
MTNSDKAGVFQPDEIKRGPDYHIHPHPTAHDNMFESLMSDPVALTRHRRGPLAREREEFLRYLKTCGTGRESIRATACYLLQIIRLLRLQQLRDVTPDEIDRAARRWGKRTRAFNKHKPGHCSAARIAWEMRRWMRFAGRLRLARPKQPFAKILASYIEAMQVEMGLAAQTIYGRRYRVADFLRWYAKRHRPFHLVAIGDADAYLLRHGSTRNTVTISSEAGALRAFFRYAEERGLCKPGIAVATKSPLIRRDPMAARGPKWADVLRLLRSTRGPDKSDIRAHALLQLFALYGIRNGEAVRLRLDDLDWDHKTLTIRRSKRGGEHQFPLHEPVARALRRYIDKARPICSCPNVFVTLNGPYRPLIHVTVSAIVHSRMLKLGVKCVQRGPQALRHACATHLLRLGSSYAEIADFLGHKDSGTVHVYAKLDPGVLREVSRLDLVGEL